jgi:hypothetical protein
VNAPEELDKLQRNLTGTLGLWRRKFATEIGEEQFRKCEEELYRASDEFEEYLSTAEVKGLTDSARQAVTGMNRALEKTAGQLRMLADSLRTYKPPRPGGRSNDFRDQDAMDKRLEAIRKSMEQIKRMAEENKRALSRPSGGAGNRRTPPRDPGYYWPTSTAVGAEHLWCTPTRCHW